MKGSSESGTSALIAYLLDISRGDTIDPEIVDNIVAEICDSEIERIRLISAVSSSQDEDVPLQVIEVLTRRLAACRDRRDLHLDRDEIYGIWGQRLAATGLVASIGFAAGGIATGPGSFAAVTSALSVAAVVTAARDRLKKHARKARRECKDIESLIALVHRAAKT